MSDLVAVVKVSTVDGMYTVFVPSYSILNLKSMKENLELRESIMNNGKPVSDAIKGSLPNVPTQDNKDAVIDMIISLRHGHKVLFSILREIIKKMEKEYPIRMMVNTDSRNVEVPHYLATYNVNAASKRIFIMDLHKLIDDYVTEDTYNATIVEYMKKYEIK